MHRRARSTQRFDGRVAVVTGASSGIGRRLAMDLAHRGAVVVGVARRAPLLAELEALLREASPSSGTARCDVADATAFAALLGDVEDKHGRIDILVNNAGIEQLTPVEQGVEGAQRRIMEVNYFGAVTGTLTVLPAMLRRGSGIVVNVASDAARAPEPRHSAYAASKAAVAAFSEAVAHEVAARGIHVHVLYPAWVPTAMGLSGQSDGGKLPPRAVRRTAEEVSALVLGRMGGRRVDINAAALPLLAPVARIVAPLSYQRAMRHWDS